MHCAKCGVTLSEGATFCTACGQPTTLASSPGGAGSIVYAGFWLRVLASLIDGAVLGAAMLLILFPLIFVGRSSLAGAAQGYNPLAAGMTFAFMAAALIGQWLYFAKSESSSWQATLGKKALGLQVTDRAGNRISFGRASARFFARIISNFTIGIGYFMAGFTEKKQALHDIIAECLVIRKP